VQILDALSSLLDLNLHQRSLGLGGRLFIGVMLVMLMLLMMRFVLMLL